MTISYPSLSWLIFFLIFAHSFETQPITITGYRSVLGPHLSHRLGDLGYNPVLSKLFKRVEPWDLSIVLYLLIQEPFELLKTVLFKFLMVDLQCAV